jgi:Fe-S-cluster-containing hydrogenase component 2
MAVVCDMCSEQLGRQPACVNACPHDAALRVEARSFFPLAQVAGRK